MTEALTLKEFTRRIREEKGPDWPHDVLSLTSGSRVEGRFMAREYWFPATIVRNGGDGLWRLRHESAFTDLESRKVIEIGDETGGYVEHVRSPL